MDYYPENAFVAWLLRLVQGAVRRTCLSRWSAFYPTYHLRPRYHRHIAYRLDIYPTSHHRARQEPRDIGLIIQGPLLKDNDFTLESVRLYQETFKHSVIIVSTWEDADPKYVEQFRAAGVEVLLNKPPSWPGFLNINYQIISSANGIHRAKQLGLKYALKTRTDQRIYAPNAEEFLRNALEAFPVATGYPQKGRIVGTSCGSYLNVSYWISDMLYFGWIDDLALFWDVELVRQPSEKMGRSAIAPQSLNRPSYELSELILTRPETYLMVEFLKKLGYSPTGSQEECFEIYAKHFCVIDQETLDLFWGKPTLDLREYRTRTYHSTADQLIQLTFRDWLTLYARYFLRQHHPA